MTTVASRFRLPVALLLLLALAFSGAAVATAEDPTYCETWDSATNVPEECEVTGEATQIGFNNFEPTMGVTPDGALYQATTPASGVAVGWRAGVARAKGGLDTAFEDGAWDDVQPQIAGYSNPPETNDPYLYVDASTGRVFSFHMSPILLCSIMSFSDDGGDTWTTPPVGCGPSGAWDHQTMVAAPPTDGVTTIGYPNVLVQCVNSVYAEMCARSLDGGLTWGSGYPVYANPNLTSLCGTQTGHLAADRDGVLYLPTPQCGDRASVYVSTDSGLTWTEKVINDEPMPFTDPAVEVDAAGTLHATWVTNDQRLQYSQSTDKGDTWTDPVAVTAPGVVAVLPALTAGDAGHVAIAYAATTDLPGGFDTDRPGREVAWGAYLSVATDATDGTPTFTTVNATGDDPIQRGFSCASRCAYLVDFLDVVLTPDGRVVGAFSDGCDNDACISGESGNNVNDRGRGMIATLDIDLCAATCHQFAPAGEVAEVPTTPHLPVTGSDHEPFVLADVIGEDAWQALQNRHIGDLTD